jgi:thioester reductase-like protein
MRDPARWPALAARLAPHAGRVRPVHGDLTRPGLGLAPELLRQLAAEIDGVLHCAADTTFSRPLDEARRVNTRGTSHLLDATAGWPLVRRLVYVSAGDAGWVNGYEQSKAEAEEVVRARGRNWIILRPSTVVCGDEAGRVTQYNAVHRALRLYHRGLAAMMPWAEGSRLDVVPAAYVSHAIATLAPRGDVSARAVHLCAGRGAMPLDELLDVTYARWARDESWRRRGVPRPALTDLETYQLFEATVEETGDARLRQVTRSLSHFVPQLALPKRFDTERADQLLGMTAPPVRAYWPRMLDDLLRARWSAAGTVDGDVADERARGVA